MTQMVDIVLLSFYLLATYQPFASPLYIFICSLQVTRSFHQLRIISDRLLAPVVASDHHEDIINDKNDENDNDGESPVSKDSIDVWNYSTERPINHDYSDCCISKNVTKKCLGFCSIKNILDGSTGDSSKNECYLNN